MEKNGRAKPTNDEMEGLFVDPVPEAGKRPSNSAAAPRAPGRAADRRRERGQAPPPAGAPDTRTSMPKREEEARASESARAGRPPRAADAGRAARGGESAMSELHPKGLAQAQLMCTRGPEEGLSLNLIEGSYTIGRARENSFVLKDIAASRRHLRIEVDGRGARVVDLGSGNGTRVNGKRIGEHELKHGDRIEIGGSVLQFQESNGASAPRADNGIDDAQERVIRAAEKLAAELSQRMRFEDGSQAAGFEDGHGAKTQAIPQATKEKLTAELKRQQQAGQQPGQPKVEKLWKETFTNLPLDKVVPADERLRGPRTAAEVSMAPQVPAVQSRALLPRPMPLPMPPIPDDEIELSGSTSRGGSFFMSLLVTTLVVVLGGGIVISFYMFSRANSGDTMSEEAAQEDYGRAMEKCREAFKAGEWFRSYEYATAALQLRPGDEMAQMYQRDSRERLDQQRTAVPAPSPAPPSPVAASPQPSSASPVPAAAPAPAPAPGPAAPAPKAAAAAAPAPAPAPVAREAAPAPVAREATPRPREVVAAPKPKPRPASKGAMTEAAAQEKFADAVDALREKDNKKGCRLLEEIADKAPPDSRWKEKAENLYSRRCD